MLLTTAAGTIMFLATGGLIFEMWTNHSDATGCLIGSGIIAFLNGFVYLVDCVLTLLKYRYE